MIEDTFNVGLVIAGIPYICKFPYEGVLYYPKGPWFDASDRVVNLRDNTLMRMRNPKTAQDRKVSKAELRRYRTAEEINYRDAEDRQAIKKLVQRSKQLKKKLDKSKKAS